MALPAILTRFLNPFAGNVTLFTNEYGHADKAIHIEWPNPGKLLTITLTISPQRINVSSHCTITIIKQSGMRYTTKRLFLSDLANPLAIDKHLRNGDKLHFRFVNIIADTPIRIEWQGIKTPKS